MKITDLVASIEVELEAAQKRESRARKTIEVTLAEIQQESRSEATDEENVTMERAFETIELAKAQQKSIQAKLARARKVQSEEADFEKRMNEATRPEGLPERSSERRASVAVGREERTYNKGNDPTGKQFLTDILRQFASNDVRSADRLNRHMREETVERAGSQYELRSNPGDSGTGAFSGLVVPQYLVDMVAPHIANLRPFADICNKHPLPANGMSVNIARITTSSSVTTQVTELDTVGAQSLNDALLTINVRTAAGQQTVSRQAIERGTGIEDIVMQDLFRQYASSLDSMLLTDATTGLQTVAHSNTVGDALLQTLFSGVMGAMSQSEQATLGMAHPTHLIMHPRRWYYLQSLLTSQWPAIASAGVPNRSLGVDNENFYNQGVQGIFPGGLGVVMDANVPTTVNTNQDVAFVVPATECHLWEEANAPVYIRAEQAKAANLGILLVVYGYFAWTFQRYTNAAQMLTGAGLAAVTGF